MQPDKTSSVSPRKLRLYGTVAIGVLAAVVVTGIITRSKGDANLKEWTDAQAIPSVAVALPGTKPLNATARPAGPSGSLFACADLRARQRLSEELERRHRRSRSRPGQKLAEIEAPDLDQQLLQARADLANSQAAAKLSAATLARRKTLLASNFVSQQEIDERSADLASKEAQVNAMSANVQRLEALASYKNVTAPFEGVVTERNTDVGALINGGTGSGAAMFVVSDVKKLRLYVNVPQNYLPGIRMGAKATVTVPEYAGRTFPGDHRGLVAVGRCVVRHDADAACHRKPQGRTPSRRFRQRQAGAVQRCAAPEHSGQRAGVQQQRVAGSLPSPRATRCCSRP